ncbi:MAG: hypothetical protein K2Y37_11605 [Pirellulales bacterium]|nr:hypothetical protein [Pirellulales bacterium]
MNRLVSRFVSLLTLASAPLFCSVASAGLSGATVNVSAYYPNSTKVFVNPGDRVVTDAVEYPAGSYLSSYNESWQVDVFDDRLTITNVGLLGFPFDDANFNGFILKVISGPTILSASADPLSDFFPVELSVQNGTDILINYSDVFHDNTAAASIIRFTTVPEPGTSTLCISGALLVVGVVARRRRWPSRDH